MIQSPGEEGRRADKSGELHGKVITMSDIAKASGVSQGAISSLLNDRDYGIRVSEKTREKVFKTCREMGYVPNDLRAVVRMYPENGELCFLADLALGDVVADPFYSRVISGAMNASGDPSHPMSVARFRAGEDFSEKPEALPHPLKWGTASKFLYAGAINPTLVQAVLRRGFPIMSIGTECNTPGVVSFLPDYTEAAERALDYLFALGHKQIAIMSGSFGSTDVLTVELNRGVRKGFEKAGVSLDGQNISFGEMTAQNGYRSMEMILGRSPKPTAVFCFSDSLAMGAIAYAQSHGIEVPRDLSIIGCGDDRFAQLIYPALTTVHLPAEELGAEAVKEVDNHLKNPSSGLAEAKKIVLPAKLVERATCTAPR